ncbi:MAG: fibronectin type III domain-containing protein [Verrucomicrobiaceae bacterium]|nr:fibronectin type III domain-containing protein [Verrucomicrobiaceae bacterium]
MAFFDSGATFDMGLSFDDPGGLVPLTPNPRKTMAKPKLELKKKTDLQLLAYAKNHIAKMTGNANFATPMPPAPELEAIVDGFEDWIASVTLKENDYRQTVVEKDSSREEVVRMLTLRSGYVEAASGGDEAKILSSGFEVRSTATPVGALTAPGNLIAKAGDNEGEIFLDWDPLAGASIFEVDCKLHTDAENFQRVKSVTDSQLLVTGLTPGAMYAFRVRGVGASGPGPWSDEAVRRAP